MKRLLPLAVLTFAAGASCGFPRHGAPYEGTGGDSAVASTTGEGGEATGTASSMAGAGGAGGAESASSSASSGAGGGMWTRRRRLTLNSGVTTALTDFPVAVLLTKTQIDFSQTQANGRDIRFTDDKNTVLDYEIERWDAGGSDPSVIWVRIPLLQKLFASNTLKIWMYYGNPQATGAENAPGVWKDVFAGVWHLSQDDNNLIDSTGQSGLATNYGTTKSAGIIGYARAFAASAHQYIDTLNNLQLNRFTVEAWAYGNHAPTTVNGPNGPLMREKNYEIVWDQANPFVGAAVFNPASPTPNGENWKYAGFNGLTGAQWYYLAATFDGAKLTSYRDGSKKNDVNVAATTTPQLESETAKLGRHAFDMTDKDFFDGVVDEVRISNKSRTADWFEAQNKSMRNDSFVTFGAEEMGIYTIP